MIGITVGLVSVLAFLFVTFPLPLDNVNADLAVRSNATALQVSHIGGEAIPLKGGVIIVTTAAGDAGIDLEEFAADVSAGDPDAWQIGETLCISCRLGGQTLTSAAVVQGGKVLAEWQGSVAVPAAPNQPPDAAFTDSCALLVCTFDGTGSSDPDGSVVAYAWSFGDGSGANGATVVHAYGVAGTYTVALNVTDDDGATDAEARPVTVGSGATVTYPDTFTASNGTVTDFPNARSATDGDAEAVLAEEDTSAGPGTTVTLDGATTADNGVASAGDVLASDDLRAELDADTDWVEVAGFDLPADATGVTSVVIGLEGRKHQTGGQDPTVTLAYRVDGVAGPSALTQTLANTADQAFTRNVTTDRSWTVADVEAATLRLDADSISNRQAEIDHVFVTVTYTTGTPTYAMQVEFSFAGVPGGAVHQLQLDYRISDENFRVQLWDGAAWNTRGATLTATSPTLWTYDLTPAEHNGGSPRVRFVDVDPAGSDRGTLRLDYARVVSA